MRLCSTSLEELSECWLQTCPLSDLFWTECLHMQLFLPLFPDLHSGICLETSPFNHTFQKSIYVPSDACARFGRLKSCLLFQSQERFLAVFSSTLSTSPGAKEGTDTCSLGTHECATSPQGWAAPEMPTGSRAFHQKLLQQTEQESAQGDYNHSHPQGVWSIKYLVWYSSIRQE